jgi:hypothetical protein
MREQKELRAQRDKYKLALERISKMRWVGLYDEMCDIADEVLHPGMVDRVDRTHEECCDCRLEAVEPSRCPGHKAGPVCCPDFVPVTPAAKKSKRQPKKRS